MQWYKTHRKRNKKLGERHRKQSWAKAHAGLKTLAQGWATAHAYQVGLYFLLAYASHKAITSPQAV